MPGRPEGRPFPRSSCRCLPFQLPGDGLKDQTNVLVMRGSCLLLRRQSMDDRAVWNYTRKDESITGLVLTDELFQRIELFSLVRHQVSSPQSGPGDDYAQKVSTYDGTQFLEPIQGSRHRFDVELAERCGNQNIVGARQGVDARRTHPRRTVKQ